MYAVQTSGSRGRREAVTLAPITLILRAQVQAAAAADGHGVIHPTHAVLRGDEVVGYASLGAVKMFFAWLDTRKLSAPESFRAWRTAEDLLVGAGPVCLPCTLSSPLLPFVERMGYQRLAEARLHLKD